MDERQAAASELRSFFERGKRAEFGRGETLINPFTYASDAYYIESGFVKVYAPSRNGSQSLLCFLGEGNMLPLPGAFGRYEVESFYIAMNNVSVRYLPASVVYLAAKNNLAISHAMVWEVYDLLMIYSNRVNTLSLRTQTERIASQLLLLSQRFGVEHNAGIILDVPITHSELAEAIASTRESVSRQLSHLAAENIIEQRNRLIIIKKPDQLLGLLS